MQCFVDQINVNIRVAQTFFVTSTYLKMSGTHMYPSHLSVGRPISSVSNTFVADMNRQNSPAISDIEHGSITRSSSVSVNYNFNKLQYAANV
jgi:hypothetical protein